MPPEALKGVDVNLAEPVAIFIARILTMSVADRLVAIAPGWQSGVDVILIGVNQRAQCDRIADDRLDRCLLYIGQQVQNHLSATLDHTSSGHSTKLRLAEPWASLAEDRRLVLFQRASAWRAL